MPHRKCPPLGTIMVTTRPPPPLLINIIMPPPIPPPLPPPPRRWAIRINTFRAWWPLPPHLHGATSAIVAITTAPRPITPLPLGCIIMDTTSSSSSSRVPFIRVIAIFHYRLFPCLHHHSTTTTSNNNNIPRRWRCLLLRMLHSILPHLGHQTKEVAMAATSV